MCKAADAFMVFITGRGGVTPAVPAGRAGGQRGWHPNCRTGWKAFGLIVGPRAGIDVALSPAV